MLSITTVQGQPHGLNFASTTHLHFHPGSQVPFTVHSLVSDQIVLDSVVSQSYNFENDSCTNSEKTEYSYDNEFNMTMINKFIWNESDSQWQEDGRTELTYTSDSRIKSMTIYQADETTGEVLPGQKMEAYYSTMIDSLILFESVADNLWNPLSKQTYLFANNRLEQMELVIYVAEDEEEEENARNVTSYTYIDFPSSNSQLSTETTQVFFGEFQMPFSKTEHFYNNDGTFRIATVNQSYNFLSSGMENVSRIEYTIDENQKKHISTYYTWNSNLQEWNPITKSESIYDETFQIAFPNFEYFFGSLLDENNRMAVATTETYDYSWADDTWVQNEKSLFYYSSDPSTGISKDTKPAVAVYPNPTTDIVRISWNGTSLILLELFDISGNKIFVKKINPNMDVNVSTLANGTYLFRLTDAHTVVHIGKLIKQ